MAKLPFFLWLSSIPLCVFVCVYTYVHIYVCVCIYIHTQIYKFSSVTQSRLTLCNPMDCSTPGFPVHHQLPELTQTHVHWASDAIQLSHPLSSPSPPAFNLSQHQGLFQWVSSLHQVAKGLEFQYQSFQWIFRTDLFRIDWLLVIQKRVVSPPYKIDKPLARLIKKIRLTNWISLHSKELSRVFSNTTVQKHPFFGTQLSL